MNAEQVRSFALSLPGATEDLKPEWGESLLFRFGGKIFVSMGLAVVPPRIQVKCTPERFAELLEIDGVSVAGYVGRFQWVQFSTSGVFRDAEIREIIRESYDNIIAKLPRKRRELLAQAGPVKTKGPSRRV